MKLPLEVVGIGSALLMRPLAEKGRTFLALGWEDLQAQESHRSDQTGLLLRKVNIAIQPQKRVLEDITAQALR